LSDQEASPRESKPSSSGKLYPILQAAFETGLIIVGLLYVALLLPRQLGVDGEERYKDLLHLFSTHNLFQPHSKYSLIGPLFSTPLWLISKQLGHPQWWTCLYNFTLFSLCLPLSYFLLRNYIDRALLRKFFLVLIYSSMFVAHLTFYYGEVFTSLCVGFGLLVTFRRFTHIGGWVAVTLGVINTPATLGGLGFLVLKRMVDGKHLRYLLVFIVATLCIVTESWLRRGNFFNAGYINTHGPKDITPYSGLIGFSYPFILGVLSILFSFGKGLLFFTSGLLLPIRKTLFKWPLHQKINLYQVYTLWICFVVGLILVYSRWWDWNGSVFWGPRFFLFASIPASFALAVRLIRYQEASLGVNLLTFVVFCLSAWVNVDGAVFQWFVTFTPPCVVQHNFAWNLLCWYTPEYSPLWLPFISHFALEKISAFFLLVATYMVAPLFIYMLKQIWDFAKQYSRKYMNLRLWHI
ncbi:MAG TPA: hypothetical protein VHV10_19840, partial [Ktedonobacteraceae bacterium]|nr:hypothetical protein [Ktedonobacteraceae bacterium]